MTSKLERLQNLKQLLESSNYTYPELAELSGLKISTIRNYVRELGLSDKVKKTISIGADSIYLICKRIFPGSLIVREYHIGDRLRIDIFFPEWKVGIEFDGKQHYERQKHFHKYEEEFHRAIDKDLEKDRICKEKGISLIRYKEVPEESQLKEDVFNAFDESGSNVREHIKDKKKTKKKFPESASFKEAKALYKAKQKQRRRELRKKYKEQYGRIRHSR